MNIKELKNIINDLNEDIEIVCRASSHGELDYGMLGTIEYNEDEEILEIDIDD